MRSLKMGFWTILMMIGFACAGHAQTVTYDSFFTCGGAHPTYTYTFSGTTATATSPVEVDFSTNFWDLCDPNDPGNPQSLPNYICSSDSFNGFSDPFFSALVVSDDRGSYPNGRSYQTAQQCIPLNFTEAVPKATFLMKPDPRQKITTTAHFYSWEDVTGPIVPFSHYLTDITLVLPPAHATYTGTFNVQPQPVVGGTSLNVGVTLSSAAESGMAVNVGSPCSNGDPLISSATDPATFPVGQQSQTYGFVAHVYSQTTTITCSPYYSWPDDPTQRTLGSYNVTITPPALVVDVAPTASSNGTVHVNVSLNPSNQYPVAFDLVSSATSVIPSRLGQTIPAAGTASFDLPLTAQGATVDSVILTGQVSTPSGSLQATGTFMLVPTFRVQLRPLGFIGPLMPFDVTPPNLTVPQQLVELGETLTVQVMPLQNGMPGAALTTTSTIVSAAPVLQPGSQLVPSPTVLFKDKVLLQFPVANTGTLQSFFGIHSGTASVSLAFQFNGTNFNLQVPLQVSNCTDNSCPETIGTVHTEYDRLLLTFADRNGIPPQLLKSQISNESSFRPDAYRYEPLSTDFALIASPERGAPFSGISPALRPWVLAEATDCTPKTIFLTQGSALPADLNSLDVNKRDGFSLALGPDNKTPLCFVYNGAQQVVSTVQISNQPLPSMQNVLFTNDPAKPNQWLELASDALVARFVVYQIETPKAFTAETVIAASYGLHQMMYTTAVERGYINQGVGLPPSGLFVPETSLDFGSQDLAQRFQKTHVAEAPSFADLMDLFSQYGPALRSYNMGQADITVPNVKTQCANATPKIQFVYACKIIKGTSNFPVQ